MWFIDVFFQQYCDMHCKSYAYFTIPSPRLSVTQFILLFLTKQNGHGKNTVFFYFFLFISVYSAKNVWVDACNSSCLVIQLQSADLSRTVTARFECRWTVFEC